MRNKRRLSYANVTSTLAVFLAMGGGAAYAATEIRSGDLAPGAVHTTDIHKRAVTSGKLALNAVRSNQIGDGAVGSKEIGAAAVAPSNLEFPVFIAATPSGGSVPVTGGPDPYPIDGGTWLQEPGQIQVLFGAGVATLAYDESGAGACRVFFEISLNGQQVGGGELSTGSTDLTRVEQSLGAQPQIDPLSPTTIQMTVRAGSNGACKEGSRIVSSRFRILDFG